MRSAQVAAAMHPSWRRPPRIVGHRGAPEDAPENTLDSFRQALVQGATAVELDARLTADGEVVVHHDRELGRTVAGDGAVEDATSADLRSRDAGSWFHPRFAHARVPTLDEVLGALPPTTLVNVELKPDAWNAETLPAAVHGVVEAHGALDRVLATSFDAGLATAYAALARRPAGLILGVEPDEGDVADWPLLGVFAVRHELLDEAALDLLRGAGKTVLAWTVNDAARAARLLDRGVAGVITDRPGALLRAMRDASAP